MSALPETILGQDILCTKSMNKHMFCILTKSNEHFYFYKKNAVFALPKMMEPYAIPHEQGYIFRDYHLGMLIIAFSHTETFADYSYDMKMHKIYISKQRCPSFFENMKVPASCISVGESVTLAAYLAKNGIGADAWFNEATI